MANCASTLSSSSASTLIKPSVHSFKRPKDEHRGVSEGRKANGNSTTFSWKRSSWALHTELLKSFTGHQTPSELTLPWLVALPWSLSLWFRPPATPSGAQSSGLQQFLPCRDTVLCPGPHIRSLFQHPPFSPPRSNDTAPTRLLRASPATSQLEPGSGRSADNTGMRGRSATGTAAACRRTDLGLLPTAVGWHRKGGWYLATSDSCLRTPALDQPGCFILPHSTAAAATLLYGSHGRRRKGAVRRAVAQAGPGTVRVFGHFSVSSSWNSAVCLFV